MKYFGALHNSHRISMASIFQVPHSMLLRLSNVTIRKCKNKKIPDAYRLVAPTTSMAANASSAKAIGGLGGNGVQGMLKLRYLISSKDTLIRGIKTAPR